MDYIQKANQNKIVPVLQIADRRLIGGTNNIELQNMRYNYQSTRYKEFRARMHFALLCSKPFLCLLYNKKLIQLLFLDLLFSQSHNGQNLRTDTIDNDWRYLRRAMELSFHLN